jgi:hypothetical protein
MACGIMLIRWDVTVEYWSDPRSGTYGLRATTRFGLSWVFFFQELGIIINTFCRKLSKPSVRFILTIKLNLATYRSNLKS